MLRQLHPTISMRQGRCVVAAWALSLHTIPASARQPVAMFRADLRHSGEYEPAGTALRGLQWTLQTNGDVIASPTVADDLVFVASGDGSLYAVDLPTGALEWRYDLGSPSHSTPAVDESTVYVVTRDGRVVAIDRLLGTPVWEATMGPDAPLLWGHESGDVYTSSPAVAEDLVVVGSGDGCVYAFDRESGSVHWSTLTHGRVRSSPAVVNGTVYVGSMDGLLYALDLESGRVRWRFETAGATLRSGAFGFDRRTIQSSPAVADGTVYFGSRDGTLYAVDAHTGTTRWTATHDTSWVNSSPAVAHGEVYAGSSDGRFVQAIDAATGEERWRVPTDGVVWSSPTVAGELVVVGDGAGVLRAVDRRDGTARWSVRLPGAVYSSPSVVHGVVIVGANDGRVYAFRTANGPTVERAVFFDSSYVRAAWNPSAKALARSLEGRGYRMLDAGALGTFIRQRIEDHAPSVVVFAIDHLPTSLAGDGGANAPLRRYLDAGGKIVWPGVPPLLWPRDPRSGALPSIKDVAWEAPGHLLGVDHTGAIFDRRHVQPTAEGRRWGLAARHGVAWGIAQDQVSEVLSVDEWGLAAEWVRSYGGPPGTGFVRLGSADPDLVFLAAEYRPDPTLDGDAWASSRTAGASRGMLAAFGVPCATIGLLRLGRGAP